MYILEPVSGENVQSVNDARKVMVYKKWDIYELTEGVFFARNLMQVKFKPVIFGLSENANDYTNSDILGAVLEFIENAE